MEKIFTPIAGETANIRILRDGKCECVLNVRLHDFSIESAPWQLGNVTIRGNVLFFEENKNPGKTATAPTLKMERVIFAPPATIVFWEDGDKTVVKCDEKDTYDPQTGLMLCWMKKLLGGKSRALNSALHAIQGAVMEQKLQKLEEFDEDTVAKALRLVKKFGVKKITGCPVNGNACYECPFAQDSYEACIKKMAKLLKANDEKLEAKTDD